jgi:hypothetical protein
MCPYVSACLRKALRADALGAVGVAAFCPRWARFDAYNARARIPLVAASRVSASPEIHNCGRCGPAASPINLVFQLVSACADPRTSARGHVRN